MKQNLTGYFLNLSRAYEIALLGGLSIQVVFEKEYLTGFDDYELIKDFYNGIEFTKSGDLVIKITQPDYISNTDHFETLEDIMLRVKSAKTNKLPTVFASPACESLLKTAAYRLNFSLSDISKVKQISSHIAQLGSIEAIRVEHVAEAIQYRTYKHDNHLCNAENKALSFGRGIQIALHNIDSLDAENAIDYLKKYIV